MAQNTTITLTAGTWTQLTDANVTAITFQNLGSQIIKVKGTTDATQPTDDLGSIRYNPGQGELRTSLSELFPGISAVRVWAYSELSVQVMVSHS